MIEIVDDMTILFQGDSITDANRDKENPENMGTGYANFTAAWLSAKYPEMNLSFINRGISGHRVKDLQARWQEDCIDLAPDVVSILIGINDVWRKFDSNDPTSVEQYEEGYRALLNETCDKLEGVQLLILEPFALPTGVITDEWREDLDPKIQVARKLAKEFCATYIPLDGMFAAASTEQPESFWLHDGVHPTQAGHALISQAWLDAVGAE